jgi:hypothetical protein
MVVGLVLSVVLAAPPSAFVVLSKRSGVATPRALEVATAVQKSLAAGSVPLGKVEDGSKCNGKRACLIALGRRTHAVSLVLVEVGAVLDEAVARVEAISVEEDGRSLGVVKHEGPLRTLAEDLATKVSGALLQPLRELHGLKDPEPLVAPPVVTVEAPPPLPLPEPSAPGPVPVPAVEKPIVITPAVASAAPAKPFFTGPRIAALAIGAAGVGTLFGALIEGLRSGGYARQRDAACADVVPCTDRYGVANANASARTGQAALILSIIGSGLLVTAGVVFIVDFAVGQKKATATVLLAPVPGGAVLGWAAQF